MPDHWIRLRGGWEWREAGLPARKVSLPMSWSPRFMAVFELVRSFQRPPIDPGCECVLLSLEDVDGLVSVWLNEEEIARPEPGATSLMIPIDRPLAARNTLVLKVDPGRCGGVNEFSSPWGTIALVIRPAAAGSTAQG